MHSTDVILIWATYYRGRSGRYQKFVPSIVVVLRHTESDEAKVLWKFLYLIQEYKKFYILTSCSAEASQHFLQFIHGDSNTLRSLTEYGKIFHH